VCNKGADEFCVVGVPDGKTRLVALEDDIFWTSKF